MKTRFVPVTLLLVLASTLVLAGCTTQTARLRPVAPVLADPSLPALAPSATAREQAGLAIDRWWLQFDDAALTTLIDEALAHNADLEAAAARVREAQAQLDLARSSRSPGVDLQVDHARSRVSAAGAGGLPAGADRHVSSHSAVLATQYEVDLWGRLASETDAARQQLLATRWARSAVQWRLSAQVAETYFSLQAVLRQLQISEATRIGREATVQLRARERTAGAGNEFNLRRAEAELTSTQASLAALGLQRNALEHSLALLTGRTPGQVVRDRLPPAALLEYRPFNAVLPQGAAADLLARRPDVREAHAQLAAAHAGTAAAQAQTLPAVRLSGVVGSDAKSLSDLFSGPAFIWSVGASLTQSLFDGGRADARVREQQARTEQAVAAYRKSVAAAFLDLREAYLTLDLNEQALAAQRDQVAALERARELARIGYERGAFPYIDLLDAERSWYQAQLQHVSAYRDQLIGQVSAFKALGGGWLDDTPRPLASNAH